MLTNNRLPTVDTCFTFAMQRTSRWTIRRLSTAPPAPWFVDPPFSASLPPRPSPRHPPLPDDVPATVKALHAHLAPSPFLEPSTLLVSRPLSSPFGLEFPRRHANGTRRKRGGTIAGESAYDVPGGIWSWVILAQVKEGTEDRGGIESVVRAVRKCVSFLLFRLC